MTEPDPINPTPDATATRCSTHRATKSMFQGLGRVQTNSQTVYRISGHESFPCRYTWLPKAVRGLSANPKLFFLNDQPYAEWGDNSTVRGVYEPREVIRETETIEVVRYREPNEPKREKQYRTERASG